MILFEKLRHLGRGTFTALLDGLFPRNCIYCEKSRNGGGEFLCGLCENEIAFIDPPFCTGCGIPADISYEYPQENFECALCRKNSYAFDRARSLGAYDSVLKQLIQHFKFCNQPGVMKDIVPLLNDYFDRRDETWTGFYVSPVPLHFRRMKQRTFDQSFLLAREVARTLGLPLANGLLLRVKDTESQAKKTRAERAKNIKGAFQINRPDRVAGLDILLVDDVLTTGATASEAAKILKRSGARRVEVFTLARALPYGNAIDNSSV
jgi:ComF family protein